MTPVEVYVVAMVFFPALVGLIAASWWLDKQERAKGVRFWGDKD